MIVPVPTDQTTQYAQDVVNGKIVAGELVVLACQRHLDDLKYGAARGLSWHPDKAQDAIEFFPNILTITEGAKEGEPFELLPWHVFVVGSIFGWKDSNGFIRFRFGWLETGKGQAKSPLMAAIGIYLFGFYGTRRAEVYCIGQDKDTARVMFRDAVAMMRAEMPDGEGGTLEDEGFLIRGTGDLAYKAEHPASGSFMLPIANGDAVSGPKPIMVAGDEIHEMKSNKGIEIWRAAVTKKYGDSILLLGTNTPSIDQHVGTEYSELCQKVLRGEFSDDSLFAYIARVDKDDDPMNDPSVWIKALPALGITYPVENIEKIVATSKHQISTALSTKRLYFGIPVGSAGFWCSEEDWDACKGSVDVDEMKGRRLHLALDLSEKNDLTSLTGVWEGETLHAKTWFYTREYQLADRTAADHIPYRELQETGEIVVTPGRVIDYSFIVKTISDILETQDVEQLVVDAAHLEKLLEAMTTAGMDHWLYMGPKEPEGEGLKIVKHKQGLQVAFDTDHLCMPTSIIQLEDHMLKGTIVIEENRLTNICASNTVVRMDGFKNKMFDKKVSRGRIDGTVTLAMGVGSATTAMDGRKVSSYLDDEEMVFF